MKSILLCVDGSEFSVTGARYATQLAKLMDARVNSIYVSDLQKFEISAVADFGGSIGTQPFHEMLSTITRYENEKAAVLEKRFSKIFADAGLSDRFQFHHKIGLLADTFDEFKKSIEGLDLIILGKAGENYESETLYVGEKVETVIRSAECPCLIAPKKYTKIKKILLAFDGSEGAIKALHFLERNPIFKNCEVHLFSIQPDKEVRATLAEAEKLLSAIPELKVTVVQKKSADTVSAIKKYSDEHHIDLLMMGSFSHSAIRQFLLGSTTLDIVEMATTAMAIF